jgi:signal transduction histidine kinase
LITAILLFSQYSVSRSRAVLLLASGYFFTALIVAPKIISYPGAFPGLLPAGTQTSAWLYYFWGAGLPLASILYACFKNDTSQKPVGTSIGWSVVVTLVLALAITWAAMKGDQFLPVLVEAGKYTYVVAYIASPALILIMAVAMGLLWVRRESILDYWLMLANFALMLQHIAGGFLATKRYSLGFYTSRGFTLITSLLVLGLLLREMTNLYLRLARSNSALERERTNRLMSLEATAASISHEIKQPLAAIMSNSATALTVLERVPPDLGELRSILSDVVADSDRAAQVLDSLRTLFGKGDWRPESNDLNELALEALSALRAELNGHDVVLRLELEADLPRAKAHRGQLREVITNLCQNAIEAMNAVEPHRRLLTVRTRKDGDKAILLEVKDTGPGINLKNRDSIFDAFVTTKPHGSGLGLAICRMIVERHGGQLSVDSDGKTGAVFQFNLPIYAAVGAV